MKRQAFLLLFFALSARAQLPSIVYSGGAGSAPDGTFQGNATFRLPLPYFAIVTGRPYSGEQVDQLTQTAADGTSTSTPTGMHQKAWRDSQGRVRIDQPYIAGPNAPKGTPTLVEIVDPAEACVYLMDDVSRVAHRIPFSLARQPTNFHANAVSAPFQFVETPAHAPSAVRIERQRFSQSLGADLLEGIELSGSVETRVIPPGAEGNDSPVTVTQENWVAPDLKLTVLNVLTDPRKGVTTRRIEHLKAEEPDPALFRVPADYRMVEETGGSFTISWGGQ